MPHPQPLSLDFSTELNTEASGAINCGVVRGLLGRSMSWVSVSMCGLTSNIPKAFFLLQLPVGKWADTDALSRLPKAYSLTFLLLHLGDRQANKSLSHKKRRRVEAVWRSTAGTAEADSGSTMSKFCEPPSLHLSFWKFLITHSSIYTVLLLLLRNLFFFGGGLISELILHI